MLRGSYLKILRAKGDLMKPVIISFLITDNERKQLKQLHRQYEDDNDVTISVSEYIRRTLFPPVSIPNPPTETPTEPVNNGKYSFNLDEL